MQTIDELKYSQSVWGFQPRKAEIRRVCDVKGLLRNRNHLDVCKDRFRQRCQIVPLVRETHPDVVIIDLMMPVLSGAEATKQILAAHHDTKILILTSYGTSGELAEAIRNGAHGVLTKDAAAENILDAVHTIAAGGRIIPDGIEKNLQEVFAIAKLTARQLEILDMVSRGFSNQDIASRYNISLTGVKKHLQTIFAKLGVSSRAEAVGIAMQRQLLKF